MDSEDHFPTPDGIFKLIGGNPPDDAAIRNLLAEFGRRHAADIVSGNTAAAEEEFAQIRKLFPSTNT